MNPFKEKAKDIESQIESFSSLYPKQYDKKEVSPYSKTRVILMNGTEFESNWFSHCMLRHIDNVDLRREISLCRFIEKQQQQKIANLKPIDETILETTISYEQLAVDLTAEMAQKEKDFNVKKALDFALLEDFDHLYRYSNLLEHDDGVMAANLVGRYTEITPARPTVAHHRHPYDNVKKCITNSKAELQTILNTMIITAAEQQTMNFYMNASDKYKNDVGRKLYQEICLVEEEHVTQYGSLIDTSGTHLEHLLWHEYTECYLYWSCYMTESDKYLRKFWEQNLEMEIGHLCKANELLKKYERKDYQEVIGAGDFPEELSLHENVDYIRNIISNTVQFTGKDTDYVNIDTLGDDDRYFKYQNVVNPNPNANASHTVIKNEINKNGEDYRFETKDNPIKILTKRKSDNVKLGVEKNLVESSGFCPLEK